MGFLSVSFFSFLLLALAAYYLVGKLAPAWQWLVLLIASLAFYAVSAKAAFFVPVVVGALTTWAGALVLEKLETTSKEQRSQLTDRAAKKALKQTFTRYKRVALVVVLVVCFVQLGYFKYFNTILFYLRQAPSTNSLGIILPLGISFYTFQSLGYLIDVYNGKVSAEKNLLKHLLFVTWFPQIIQGPINVYEELAPQLMAPRSWDGVRAFKALLRFGYGVLKKFAIANALYLVDTNVFDNLDANIPGIVVVWAIITYSIQMYADFSGGIDMVEGISEFFGVEMSKNFAQPYFSTSLAEFWRRWHMSLGVWMRNYVFYPLALTKPMQNFGKWAGAHLGKHAGRTLPACVANIVVFVLVGFWHGAEIHYLLWGFYNGVIIALADLLAPAFERLRERLGSFVETLPYRIFAIARTLAVVAVGRIFDRCGSGAAILTCFKNILTNFAPTSLSEGLAAYGVSLSSPLGFPLIALIACAYIFVVSLLYERKVDVRERIIELSPVALVSLLTFTTLLIAASFCFIPNTGGGFMYANF